MLWLNWARRVCIVCTLCFVAIGCGDSQSVGLPFDGNFPKKLSTTGVFELENPNEPGPGVQLYEPEFPLWSNGSDKTRWVADPLGRGTPPTSDLADGTLFFKTFAYAGKKIETRVLRLDNGEAEYAVYRWNEAGDDATRLNGKDPVAVQVELDGKSFQHEIPSHDQCVRCHEANPTPVLGFSDTQLSGELPASVDAADADVVGYALGNCTHCHNGGEGDGVSYDLRPEKFISNTVNRRTEGSASAIGIRVVPGDAEESILYQAMVGGFEEVKPMPPLGVQLRDDSAHEMFRQWIDSLTVE